MINAIKQKLGICKAVAAVTYKEWSAYRTHSLVSVFVGPVYFIVQYFIWTAVYGDNGILGGMELEQTICYFGVIALIGYLTMDFADWNLQMLVQTGKFLTFALRPMHHRFYALSQKIGHRILGFFLEFLPCFVIFEFLFKVDIIPPHIGWTILSVGLAFLMNFYVNYCLGMTAFFLVRADGIRRVYQLAGSVLSGAMIPLSFFPEPLCRIMMFLPFQYTGYIPAMVWTGSESIGAAGLTIPQAVMCQAVAVLLAALLSEVIYRASIKRFTAVGA
ncbi:MAG: ABC-2 family transporter protein [Oscillospiraceae bacterium]|nr:ABC-2 family transporter protein [Oscillospiraceae bacterium]